MSRPEDDLNRFLLAHQLAKADEPARWRPLTAVTVPPVMVSCTHEAI
jgi:hypothetical protein